MCGFEVVEQREYVPHPLPALLVGVLVIGIGIGLNIYLTGEMFRYTGHGYGLLVLGIFTVFAAAGSVTIDTQWIFSAGMVLGAVLSTGLAPLSPLATVRIALICLQAGFLLGAVLVGLLAFGNSTFRRRAEPKPATQHHGFKKNK